MSGYSLVPPLRPFTNFIFARSGILLVRHKQFVWVAYSQGTAYGYEDHLLRKVKMYFSMKYSIPFPPLGVARTFPDG